MKKLSILILFLLSAAGLCLAQNLGDVSAMGDTATEVTPVIPIDQLPSSWQGPAALIGIVIMVVGRIVYGLHSGKNFWEALGSAIFKGNNQKKVLLWIAVFLSASVLISCNPSTEIYKITYEKNKTCFDGRAKFDSPVPLNQDSLLKALTQMVMQYAYVKHVEDSGQTRKYEWGLCLPNDLFQNNSMGDAFH